MAIGWVEMAEGRVAMARDCVQRRLTRVILKRQVPQSELVIGA
jgi:hypothetical protein